MVEEFQRVGDILEDVKLTYYSVEMCLVHMHPLEPAIPSFKADGCGPKNTELLMR